MAIRNTLLGGVDFTSTTEATATDFNDTFDAVYNKGGIYPAIQSGLNSIRQMIDRDAPVSKGGIDGFTEAYIDSNGRKNTVITGSTDATFDTDKYKVTGTAESIIYHNITSDVLISSTNQVIGIPLYEDYESGVDIQYKIYNSTTDSGWLDSNTFSTTAQFAQQPSKLQVKLIPSSTSPTSGYPSINGISIYCLNNN